MSPFTEDGWVDEHVSYTPDEFYEQFYCDRCGKAHWDYECED